MTSAVSICSNALLMLGDNPISAFVAATDRARLAANVWPTARDYVLRMHPWNCAVKRVTLAPAATTPDFEFAAQFVLPEDCLRVLSVGQAGERIRYRLESGRILMDENVCRLRYIWRNDQPASWDAILVWAMTQAMRAVFSYGVTQSASLESMIEDALKPILRNARAVDGQEDIDDSLDESPLILARYSGSA